MAEFEIPLLSESSHQAIDTSFSRSDIIELADDCQRDFENNGPQAVIKQYCLLYSVIRRFDELDGCVREQYWTLTLKALEGLCQKLGSLEIVTLSANEKKHLRNSTKMLCYVAVRMVELYEREPSPVKQQATRKKKPQPPESEPRVVGGVPVGGKQWIVCLLSQLSELELVGLWDPPSPQMMENWSGLIAQLCYKLLENNTISKDQTLRDRVIHLLGVLVRDYGQALSVALKVIQLLQHFDHLVSLLANAVAIFTTQFNCKNVAVEVVRELGSKDPRDLVIDSSGTRSYASFLVELCHLVPDCVLLSVSVLLPHLNGESYTFRNGVLGVMAELLLHLHKSPLNEQARQLRDTLFTKLEDHIHDTNAFVRVKVLQLLLQLITFQAIPLPRVHTEVTLVAGRLRDKSSSVRKNALQLLAAWLTHNPFSGKLSKAEFEEKLSTEQCHLRQLVGDCEGEGGERDEVEESQTLKQTAVVQYYTDALLFINALQDCVPTATQLLGSKVASDVLEALEFLCIAEQFSLSCASEGLRKALVLVWSRDDNIKKALINTYVKIYLTFDPKMTRAQQSTQIIDNLLLLTRHSTAGELASLHQLVDVLVEAGHIPMSALKALMELCIGCHGDRSRLGMQLLVMTSAAQSAIIRSNLDALVSIGFTQNQTSPDLLLAKYVCQVIQNLVVSKSKGGTGKGKSKPLQSVERLPCTHLMFSQLHSLLVAQLTLTSDLHWCPLAEQALTLVYKLSNQPDQFAEKLLKELVRKTFTIDPQNGEISSAVLSRLLFCVGQVAFLQMVHCEVVVAKELKNKRASNDSTNTSGKTSNSTRKSLGVDDGLELTGASADDSEVELIKKILELEIGGAGGLLATFEPLIVGVVSNPSKYSCPALQTAACLTLAKYMMISSSLCEKYVQLFFTVLEKSSLECVRANTVIAASDLACRFPNLLEPWTPYIYSRLQDPTPLVRRNALTVLTHLILNDMVKVRGQISSMAMCLEDSDPKIADLAKLFFHELAQKGNALYNVLPDIISHLSDPSTANKQTSFQNIVKFLFGFIQKDRLCESLVEKLCHRFRAARSVEQHHDLAYCLTLLPVTERTLRKLQENVSCYQDKLVDTQVYAAFTTIISKLKKLSKPDLKTAVEEFEQRLEQIHTKGLGEDGGRKEQRREEEQEEPQHEPDNLLGRNDPLKASDSGNEDFSNDVLTSARKQLVTAIPTTPLSVSAQGMENISSRVSVGGSRTQGTKHRSSRRRMLSSDSETENQEPRTKLQLDCSSDSDFTQ